MIQIIKKLLKAPKKHPKSENEGRTFECKICNKSYLSYPALYTHCKKKNHINNSSGRGRGRPKKEGLEMETEKTKYNPIMNNLLKIVIIHIFLKKKEMEKLKFLKLKSV